MKIRDLINIVFDKVIIYKSNKDEYEYEDIYKGSTKDIPKDILEMNVRAIGASRKGIVDIQVF